MLEWLASWDWGDVPGWIAVILGIAIPLIAYFERNRIAGFFRRQAAEPLPALPPVRWLLRPTQRKNVWAVINNSDADAHNATIRPTMLESEVMDAGFWAVFPRRCLGTVTLRRHPDGVAYGQSTEFRIDWQDDNGAPHAETLSAPGWVDFEKGLNVGHIADGKVATIDILIPAEPEE